MLCPSSKRRMGRRTAACHASGAPAGWDETTRELVLPGGARVGVPPRRPGQTFGLIPEEADHGQDRRALRHPPSARQRCDGGRLGGRPSRDGAQGGAQAARSATAMRRTRPHASSASRGSLPRSQHPHIVVVHDFFEHDGLPCIAMELVPGGSLRPTASMRMTTPPRRSACWPTCSTPSATPRRADRPPRHQARQRPRRRPAGGSSSPTSASPGRSAASRRTDVADIAVGTPAYMAPEQATAGPVGPCTDLYAVGMMAFHLLAKPRRRSRTSRRLACCSGMSTRSPGGGRRRPSGPIGSSRTGSTGSSARSRWSGRRAPPRRGPSSRRSPRA